MPIPHAVIWEITRRCNFDCAHCIVAASKKAVPNEITTAQAKKFIKTYASLGGRILGFSGGEPLLRQDLEEIVACGREFGFANMSLATNGYILTRKRIESLKEAGITSIQVSLDGATAEQNAAIRTGGPGAFRKAIEGVRHAKSSGVGISIGIFLHPDNIVSVPQMLEICRAEGVSILRFSGFVPMGRGRNPEVLRKIHFTEEQIVGLLRFVSSHNPEKTGVNLIFDHSFGPFYNYFTCGAGKDIFYMCSDGSIYPCSIMMHPELKVGNAFEENFENLRELLESDKMNNCRVPGDKITGACAGCKDLYWCKGGCRGAAFAYFQDIFASFPNCLRIAQKTLALTKKGIRMPFPKPLPGEVI